MFGCSAGFCAGLILACTSAAPAQPPTSASPADLPVVSVKPLTVDQKVRLDTAKDDRPLVADAGLDGLLDNVRSWTLVSAALDDAASTGEILSQSIIASVVEAPSSLRGQLFHIQGRLTWIERGSLGYGDLETWRVELDDDSATILILVDVSGEPRAAPVIKSGSPRVSIPARFYKTVVAVKRATNKGAAPTEPFAWRSDAGRVGVAVFVGAYPRLLPDIARRAPLNLTVALPIAALVIALIMVLLLVRLLRSSRRRQALLRGIAREDAAEPEIELPAEPDRALAELHRRARGDRAYQRQGHYRDGHHG